MPKVMIDVSKVVVVTGNYSGYLGGKCLVCNASGWLDGLGYPHSHRNEVMSNRLIHTKDCPLNKYLTNKGTIKGS